ncbi:MAG: DUF3726 domain-containing protein [Sediminimonas qiaohouensis]|uniref:DUF3726 domain-containing protein n=1 Tax=Sediminimonas qiaohouensis TaxID=552061 RepID=A0A7C9LMI1_9RHOB|nr:DUF3726 domain-containing protein [Sediminimonas qiaohouensis]MTJ05579.1 DUF3726 domain-containing protein [Sediminimonas qiaohouensis]
MTPQPNDPTQVGSEPPRDEGDGLRLSRPEIQALGTKAARGAGYAWGQAEEAGWAAGWLARAGLPGAAILLNVLKAQPLAPPAPASGHWKAKGPQCPLCTGLALQDHAGLPEGPGPSSVLVDSVIWPVFLMPFVARAAAALGAPLEMAWADVRVTLPADGAMPTLEDPASVRAPEQATVRITVPDPKEAVAPIAPAAKDNTGAGFEGVITLETWQKLDTLAMCTTVTSSIESRVRAGAQESDND